MFHSARATRSHDFGGSRTRVWRPGGRTDLAGPPRPPIALFRCRPWWRRRKIPKHGPGHFQHLLRDLLRVWVDPEGLGGHSTPDELVGGRIHQVDHERAGGVVAHLHAGARRPGGEPLPADIAAVAVIRDVETAAPRRRGMGDDVEIGLPFHARHTLRPGLVVHGAADALYGPERARFGPL